MEVMIIIIYMPLYPKTAAWGGCGPQSPYHESIWEEEVYIHTFLTLALERGKWLTS
jgi:hypothetical protein